MHPQLPAIARQAQFDWITRYQEAMAEIDRQLAELPMVIEAVKAEVGE